MPTEGPCRGRPGATDPRPWHPSCYPWASTHAGGCFIPSRSCRVPLNQPCGSPECRAPPGQQVSWCEQGGGHVSRLYFDTARVSGVAPGLACSCLGSGQHRCGEELGKDLAGSVKESEVDTSPWPQSSVAGTVRKGRLPGGGLCGPQGTCGARQKGPAVLAYELRCPRPGSQLRPARAGSQPSLQIHCPGPQGGHDGWNEALWGGSGHIQ